MSQDTWLVAGLGNPGPGYTHNRHNIGQHVADELADRLGANFKTHKARAQVAEGRLGIGGPRLVVAKPMTYMNLNGGPVSALSKFYSIPPANIIALHDEIDIDFNTVRLKLGGSENGHNGLRDMSKALGTKNYLRVRIGVGRPPGRMDAAAFVLKDFNAAEKKELPFLLDDAADAAALLVTDGLEAAQARFSGR
ncbi:aminoacyl-tRNA hydrolase [Zhihengliuella salsuginis]|uniref:Peptidyl-tRNA hydrolase n=1 Tax=Zhihengliuella salsuginis TaxID=578222 RepID=A0ABQ3GKY0_9MICC|nr:aminoacyl-tRNA hydrolase [Zhihengliuella salsuginis]GHD09827.1 peptidyl-tRNA hydrolase [Zhihengliuella salsuginis]